MSPYAAARTDLRAQLLGSGLSTSTQLIHFACRQWPAMAAALSANLAQDYGLRLGSPLGEGVSLGPYVPASADTDPAQLLPALCGDIQRFTGHELTPWHLATERGGLRHLTPDELNLHRLRGGEEPVYPGRSGSADRQLLELLGPGTGSGTLLLRQLIHQSTFHVQSGHPLRFMGASQGWKRRAYAPGGESSEITLRTNIARWLACGWTLSGGPEFRSDAGALYWDGGETMHHDPSEDSWAQMLASAGSLAGWPQTLRDLRQHLTEKSRRSGRPEQSGVTFGCWQISRQQQATLLQRRVRLCVQDDRLIQLGVVQATMPTSGQGGRAADAVKSAQLRYGQWSSRMGP